MDVKLLDQEIETYHGPSWVYAMIHDDADDPRLIVHVYKGKPHQGGTLVDEATVRITEDSYLDVLDDLALDLSGNANVTDSVVRAVGSAAIRFAQVSD